MNDSAEQTLRPGQKARNSPPAHLSETFIALDPADSAAEAAWRQSRKEAAPDPGDTPRAGYERYTGSTPKAEGITFEQVLDGNVRGWWCRPSHPRFKNAAILYLHGGGYALGSAEGYRGMGSQIAVRTGLPVFNLDYPLAPEELFPAAYNATVRVYSWLAEQGIERIGVMGDSAGGSLTLASVAHLTVSPGKPKTPRLVGCVTFSPWTDLGITGETRNSPDPIFTLDLVQGLATRYLGNTHPEDPRASPLYGVPFGMPPLYIQVGSNEILLDDSVRYAKAAVERGANVTLEIWEGMHHTFQHCVEQLASSRRALDLASEFLIQQFVQSGEASAL